MKGQTLVDVFYKSKEDVKNNSPTILTVAGAVGVIVTGIMAAKATPKAIALIAEAEYVKGEELTSIEKVEVTAKVYIPTILVGASTIGCILGANNLNKNQQAMLTSALSLMDNTYREYKDKSIEVFGEDAESKIISAVAKKRFKYCDLSEEAWDQENTHLFYEEYSGEFFEATIEDVLSAEYHFNRNFVLRGYAALNEFYEFLNIPKTDLGEELGWSLDAGEVSYGYSWVDFEHKKITMDDGLEMVDESPGLDCYIITYPFSPTADYIE